MQVRFINFGWNSAKTPTNWTEALNVAKQAGFESAIYSANGELLGTYSPLYGVRKELSAKYWRQQESNEK